MTVEYFHSAVFGGDQEVGFYEGWLGEWQLSNHVTETSLNLYWSLNSKNWVLVRAHTIKTQSYENERKVFPTPHTARLHITQEWIMHIGKKNYNPWPTVCTFCIMVCVNAH